MNLLCWLLGHFWEAKWTVAECDGKREMFVVCVRCGAKRPYRPDRPWG